MILPLRRSDHFVIAAWAAVSFGLIEGTFLDILRGYPRILAPYKATNHLLWIAPLLDTAVFLVVATGLVLLLPVTRRWTAGHEGRLSFGLFAALGAFAVLDAPGVLHPAAAAVLSLGVATAVTRALAGREASFASALRRRIVWLPVVLALAAAGVTAAGKWRESSEYRALPAVNRGAS